MDLQQKAIARKAEDMMKPEEERDPTVPSYATMAIEVGIASSTFRDAVKSLVNFTVKAERVRSGQIPAPPPKVLQHGAKDARCVLSKLNEQALAAQMHAVAAMNRPMSYDDARFYTRLLMEKQNGVLPPAGIPSRHYFTSFALRYPENVSLRHVRLFPSNIRSGQLGLALEVHFKNFNENVVPAVGEGRTFEKMFAFDEVGNCGFLDIAKKAGKLYFGLPKSERESMMVAGIPRHHITFLAAMLPDGRMFAKLAIIQKQKVKDLGTFVNPIVDRVALAAAKLAMEEKRKLKRMANVLNKDELAAIFERKTPAQKVLTEAEKSFREASLKIAMQSRTGGRMVDTAGILALYEEKNKKETEVAKAKEVVLKER